MDRHLTILLIILVLSVTFIGLNIKEDFSPGYLYIPVKNTKTLLVKFLILMMKLINSLKILGGNLFGEKIILNFQII